jgi:uncharacterized iron-regulated membrane protein
VKRAVKPAVRDALMVFHRWAALAATIFILIVAVSGSALVFEGAIDRALNPGLWRVAPTGAMLSVDTLVARARAAAPTAAITGITFPPVADLAVVIQAGAVQSFVDPYTGTVKGTRTAAEFNATLPRRLHVLHVSLMGGKVGGEIVGVVTILSLLLVATGVVLWWPDKLWRVRWSASWKRVVFDLHHAAGVIAAVVLLVITTSGLFIHYQSLNGLMAKLNTEPVPVASSQPAGEGGAAVISADSLFAVARSALPGARVMFLSLPTKADQPFVAALRYPEDHTPGGRSRVFVNRFTGAPLQVRSTRVAEVGTRLGNSIRSIHTGDLWGKPTEAVWLLAAIALASQTMTGCMMWWNGRAARAALKRKETAAPVQP